MATITTRAGKGTPLTNTEVDNNFSNLNSAKYESGSVPTFGDVTIYDASPHLKLEESGGGSKRLELSVGSDAIATISANQSAQTMVFQVSSYEVARFHYSNGVSFNEGSADRDFRVESNDNANMLTVDAGENRVGVGTTGGGGALNVLRNEATSFSVTFQNSHASGYGQSWNSYSGHQVFMYQEGGYVASISTASNHVTYSTSSSADLHLQAGGTREVTVNNSGAATDFRVESDALTHLFFVDASENGVGIGDGSVQANGLRISSSTGTTNAVDTKLYLNARSSGTTTTGFGPGIVFAGDRNGDGNTQQMARINAVAEVNSGTTLSSGLSFQTATAGVNSAKMTINNLGSVGIGVADGDVTSDGTAARTYVGIIGTANRGRLNLGSTASNGADVGTLAFTNGANTIADISVDSSSGSQTVGSVFHNSSGSMKFQAANNYGYMFNESGVDTDFRVESDSYTHMFYVDAGSDHVNIGTSTDHGGVLNVQTTGNNVNLVLACTDTGSNEGPILDLTRDAGNVPTDGDVMGAIRFRNDNTNLEMQNYARIEARAVDVSAGTEDGRLEFTTIVGGADNLSRLLLNATETAVNDNSANLDFRVESDGNANMLFVDGGNNKIILGGSTQDAAGTLTFVSGTGLIRHVHPTGTATDNLLFAISGTNNGFQTTIDSSNNITYKFHTGGNTKAVEFGTTESVFNDNSVDRDFRVESNNNTNMLFVDGGADVVGVGTGSNVVDSANTSYQMVFPNHGGIAIGSAYTFANIMASDGNIYLKANAYPANTGSTSKIYFTTANASGGLSSSVIVDNGNLVPQANGSQDLGSAGVRWANVYTGDLHLSNEAKGANEMDGTTGDWTIQEGAENLYIKNNKTGKKYKFALEEIE